MPRRGPWRKPRRKDFLPRPINVLLESHSYTRFLVNVVRHSLEELPDLKESISSGNIARIVSKSDLQSLSRSVVVH